VVGLGAAEAAARPLPLGFTAGKPQQLTLQGQGWQLQAPGRKPGDLPIQGDQLTIFGELLDTRGNKVGEFYGTHAAALRPFGETPFAAGAVEMHTFNLEGGMLLGMGTSIDGVGTYAIAGGTGRYAGVRGSYTATQRPLQLRGDGTAEFTLDLTA
jgi:hypothetical protein